MRGKGGMDAGDRGQRRSGNLKQEVEDWRTSPFSRMYQTVERIFCGNSSVVERDLAKVDVAGPTPVSRFLFISGMPVSCIKFSEK